MEIAKLNYPEEFRFSMLVPPPSPNPTATEQAFYDILAAFDSLWPQTYFQELFFGHFGQAQLRRVRTFRAGWRLP